MQYKTSGINITCKTSVSLQSAVFAEQQSKAKIQAEEQKFGKRLLVLGGSNDSQDEWFQHQCPSAVEGWQKMT